MGWPMGNLRRWKEQGETLVPTALAGVALVLDMAEDGESWLHAAAVAIIASVGIIAAGKNQLSLAV